VRDAEYLLQLKDGTIKQLNPFNETEVWTIPGRADRPYHGTGEVPVPLDRAQMGRHCAFCERRYYDTPPEKSRVVTTEEGYAHLDDLAADELFATTAHFRQFPNLFEIITLDYWRLNYGYELPAAVRERQAKYLATNAGRTQISNLLVTKRQAQTHGGKTRPNPAAMNHFGGDALSEASAALFGGSHDVIAARRHYIEGAQYNTQLAGSGTLTPDEHGEFIRFTAFAARNILEQNRYARYAVIFQNWLKAAGASFDHLHKQIVAIDEHGEGVDDALDRAVKRPNLFNEVGANYAIQNNLVIAENQYAIAFAGFGHRYPSIEIYSKAAANEPWAHSDAEIRGVSDVLHAMHAATGVEVPTNEEWHYRPKDSSVAMPWRIVLKWRISNIAGFEGATRIYLNTISPWSIRERLIPDLMRLRDLGQIAPMAIGDECCVKPNPLHYLEEK
jgi:galactose-1-phosphate uridylyltransferase